MLNNGKWNDVKTEPVEEWQRVNNDTWICNQLEDLVAKYEGYLKADENKDLDEYEQGEHNELLAVVTELKELLYNK